MSPPLSQQKSRHFLLPVKDSLPENCLPCQSRRYAFGGCSDNKPANKPARPGFGHLAVAKLAGIAQWVQSYTAAESFGGIPWVARRRRPQARHQRKGRRKMVFSTYLGRDRNLSV
jgi:hypothetical protein